MRGRVHPTNRDQSEHRANIRQPIKAPIAYIASGWSARSMRPGRFVVLVYVGHINDKNSFVFYGHLAQGSVRRVEHKAETIISAISLVFWWWSD